MKYFLIFAVAVLASCGHKHEKDRVIGDVHTVYLKDFKNQRAKLVDSLMKDFKKKAVAAPVAVGFYSAGDNKLPTGTIMDFHPILISYTGPGPYLVTIKHPDGMLTINKISREQWLMFHRGDILK